MTARSIAALTLSFGLVSIPVRLYSATETASSVRFTMLAKDGARLKQQYVTEDDQTVVARADIVKGYEFEHDHFVLFTPDELKALEESSNPSIDIVAFIPDNSIEPIFYDKAYLLAPDKRGGKPYALLVEAMRSSGRCALAKWAWKSKQYVVQIRSTEDGLILQQLYYADEVRSLKDLDIELAAITPAELQLAVQIMDQLSADSYDPGKYEGEEKKRILAAIDEKISGKKVVASARNEEPESGEIIDLMKALKASLGKISKSATVPATKGSVTTLKAAKERKTLKRTTKTDGTAAAPPIRSGGKK